MAQFNSNSWFNSCHGLFSPLIMIMFVVCICSYLCMLYEIMWNTCVTLIYSFIMYILICTSRSLLQCCTSKCNVMQCRAELLVV